MRLSKANRRELEVLRYFAPITMPRDISAEDIDLYFAYSDRGERREEYQTRIIKESQVQSYTGLSSLHYGKRNRDLQVAMYLEDWGETITAVDFVDEPRYIAEFISKAIRRPGVLKMWLIFNAPSELPEDALVDDPMMWFILASV